MKKTIHLFLFTFIVSVAYGQSIKNVLLERNKVHTIESLRALNNGNNPFDKEGFQSNFEEIPTIFTQGNSNFLSRTKENELRLDSIVNVNVNLSSRYEQNYDANVNSTLYIYYTWNTDSQSFVPFFKLEYTYDANGNRTLFIGYVWNTNSESFVLLYKDEYTYDANGNRTLVIAYVWNTNSESFVPDYKDEYTYDANGNMTLDVSYTWSTDSESFVPDYKYEYTYNANGNWTLRTRYTWETDNESFVLTGKTEYTYDANGNRTLDIYYRWNTDSQSFVLDYKSEYTYDANGNRTLYILYLWQTGSESLVPVYKYEYTYNTNGNTTLRTRYTWNTDSESFVPSFKYEYTYDETKVIPLTTEVLYYWYPSFGVFKPGFKKEYTIIMDNETSLARMGTISKYNTNFNQWSEVEGEEFKSYEYYTKMTTLSIEEFNETLFSIYPNPTSDYIHVKTAKQLLRPQFELFDVLGKKVLSQPIKATEAIDVQHLKSSLYFYRIKEGKEIHKSGTLIKQNK
jgi:hypothetical protein